MRLLVSQLLLALLIHLARTTWTSERQQRIDEYRRRNEADQNDDLEHLDIDHDHPSEDQDTARNPVVNGLQAALLRAQAPQAHPQ